MLAQAEKTTVEPLEASFIALSDAASLGSKAHHVRYIYLQQGDRHLLQCVNKAVNEVVYNAATIIPPTIISPNLLRIDLHEGNGSFETWEKLYPDLTFQMPKGVFGLVAKKIEGDYALVDCEPWTKDGVTYREKWVKRSELSKLTFAPHALPHTQALSDKLRTNVPIVEARYFIVRSCASVDYGFGEGLYYQFAGVRKSQEKGLTDQDQFLKDFFKINLSEIRADLADSRVGIGVSGVTKKPRAAEVVQGSSHPARSDGLVYITHDIRNKDANAKQNPFRELLGFIDQNNDAAREIIGPKRNGHHVFYLGDNQGNRQDKVPDDIARWHGFGGEYTTELVAGISCMECHSREKNENGIKDLPNHVLLLYKNNLGPTLDLSTGDSRRLQSSYAGELSASVNSSRNFYADAVFQSSGGLTVHEASQGCAKLFSDYIYTDVTPEMACLELGLGEQVGVAATAKLGTIMGRMKVVDPIFGLLVSGVSVRRVDFMGVLADARLAKGVEMVPMK